MPAAFGEPTGQGWAQLAELAIAFVLSLAIGAERESRQKSAGLRTYTLVGVGAALFVLLSKYGFTDVLGPHVTLDPSRVAAQIVTGVGFIGGGLIFVRHDAVRGLTTAASVWLTAAVGAAAGAGLDVLAVAATALYFLVVFGLRPLHRMLARIGPDETSVRVRYLDGHGVLRELVRTITHHGFLVAELTTVREGGDPPAGTEHITEHITEHTSEPTAADAARSVEVTVTLSGRGDPARLAEALTEVSGVLTVRTGPTELA